MDQIMDKVNETAQFAKYAGGVGTSITKLRSSGSHIHSINAKSSGPIPFIKIFDSVINGVVQGGKRRASQVMYMEPRHYNIYEFLYQTPNRDGFFSMLKDRSAAKNTYEMLILDEVCPIEE